MTIPIENKNPKLIKIIDEDNLKFQCKVCSEIWLAIIKPGGEISWQCPQGCVADCNKNQGEKKQIKAGLKRIRIENNAISKRLASAITLIGSIRTSQLGIEAIIIDLEAKLNKK